mmetsp:Transcript_16952/g.45644  ORF Transcript_16952/g.45644 Transcript_16952/m.45644 type:complete len:306 (-) Transcript_16952:221-1138(-)
MQTAERHLREGGLVCAGNGASQHSDVVHALDLMRDRSALRHWQWRQGHNGGLVGLRATCTGNYVERGCNHSCHGEVHQAHVRGHALDARGTAHANPHALVPMVVVGHALVEVRVTQDLETDLVSLEGWISLCGARGVINVIPTRAQLREADVTIRDADADDLGWCLATLEGVVDRALEKQRGTRRPKHVDVALEAELGVWVLIAVRELNLAAARVGGRTHRRAHAHDLIHHLVHHARHCHHLVVNARARGCGLLLHLFSEVSREDDGQSLHCGLNLRVVATVNSVSARDGLVPRGLRLLHIIGEI